MDKTIGILLPKSVLYPSLSFDMMAGLKNGLAAAGVDGVNIKAESIGVGADNKQIYAACEKLLFDGCQVIAGYVNPSAVEMVAPLFSNTDAIFIVLDSGMHFPSSLAKKTNVFVVSLHGALCSRMIAKTAISEGRQKFAFVGSFYDAGYRSLLSFSNGVDDGNGGFTFNHITKLKRQEFTLEPLQGHLQSSDVDAVFASYCGDMMQDLFTAAASSNIFEHHPVYGSMFMGDEQWLEQCPYPSTNIKTCVTWATSLDNAENKKFIDSMAGKQKINLFSMICWEAAQIMPAIFDAADAAGATTNLEGLRFNSPRGEVIISAENHYTYPPVYEALIRKNENTGNCLLEIIRVSPFTEEQIAKHVQDINEFSGHATSWHNSYPCLES